MSIFGEEKKERTKMSKKEWEAIKKQSGNRCLICGETEKKVGILRRVHLRAHSRGGTQYVPLCSNCHYKYDSGKLSVTELKKLGITKADYERFRPKRKTPKEKGLII